MRIKKYWDNALYLRSDQSMFKLTIKLSVINCAGVDLVTIVSSTGWNFIQSNFIQSKVSKQSSEL